MAMIQSRLRAPVQVHVLGAPPASGNGVPWWYRYVRSWRLRMWLETGVWEGDFGHEVPAVTRERAA